LLLDTQAHTDGDYPKTTDRAASQRRNGNESAITLVDNWSLS